MNRKRQEPYCYCQALTLQHIHFDLPYARVDCVLLKYSSGKGTVCVLVPDTHALIYRLCSSK